MHYVRVMVTELIHRSELRNRCFGPDIVLFKICILKMQVASSRTTGRSVCVLEHTALLPLQSSLHYFDDHDKTVGTFIHFCFRILKANKVNLFVSSVLFVFWYHSPNIFIHTTCYL
jgi:hypothetical protein